MLLVVDVGNTNTVVGLWRGQELSHDFRFATRRDATSDEIGTLILSLIERRKLQAEDVKGAIVASVVPQQNRPVVVALQTYFQTDPVVVGPGIKTGMPILVDNPAEVGADRIVNSVAAWQRVRSALIVADFGTATTFDAVNAKGEYMGGVIAPGPDVSMDALFARAAKLPRIELKPPQKAIGKNTVHALQSGLFFGYVGLVDEITRRVLSEIGGPARVIATGGLAEQFAQTCQTIDEVDPHLTLEGLRILYEMNQS